MPYLYAVQDRDYSDYASGRVIYNLPGAAAFPIRLASEIFQRAQAIFGGKRKLALFDPTCGAAYHLCALGFLHGEWIESIAACDIDDQAVQFASRNIGLLSQAGLSRRIFELKKMRDLYGKPSHSDALRSATTFQERLNSTGRDIPARVFQANALDTQSMQFGLAGQEIDLVFCDIPYGNLSTWGSAAASSPDHPAAVTQMLAALLPVIQQKTIVVIVANKQQKAAHPAFRRITQFNMGKRLITFLTPLD